MVFGGKARDPAAQVLPSSPVSNRLADPGMANNPVPLIVACHRVLASDGTLHGYGGGLDMKRALLTMEGVELPKSGRLR